jgi:hypothetical protein
VHSTLSLVIRPGHQSSSSVDIFQDDLYEAIAP